MPGKSCVIFALLILLAQDGLVARGRPTPRTDKSPSEPEMKTFAVNAEASTGKSNSKGLVESAKDPIGPVNKNVTYKVELLNDQGTLQNSTAATPRSWSDRYITIHCRCKYGCRAQVGFILNQDVNPGYCFSPDADSYNEGQWCTRYCNLRFDGKCSIGPADSDEIWYLDNRQQSHGFFSTGVRLGC